ncbi:hypothetical protein [Streptomyces sp. NPDC048489]|uniref:hypothetical protein n=1 Tax=Streptomyces sp. NPDC048489 TaxID=3154504 RepID=UPI00343A0ECD
MIHLRHDLPHSVLGLLIGVERFTVTRAIGEIRTLLAEWGCAVSGSLGLRFRTLTDVFAYVQAEGIELRLDATETRSAGSQPAEADDGLSSPARGSRTP